MEVLAACEAYPEHLRDRILEDIEYLPATWDRVDPTSIVWQHLLRDGCLQTTSWYFEGAAFFGCDLPPTPELAAWSTRRFEPPLGSPEDECGRAGDLADAYLECPMLAEFEIVAGELGVDMIELTVELASRPGANRRIASARCRYAGEALSQIAADRGC